MTENKPSFLVVDIEDVRRIEEILNTPSSFEPRASQQIDTMADLINRDNLGSLKGKTDARSDVLIVE